MPSPVRLAILVSHPIQYYAPWFQCLAHDDRLHPRVFYLWNFGVTSQLDRAFGRSLQWDVDLTSGYEHEFVPNESRDPGTHHFRGLYNPQLRQRVAEFSPDAALVFGYAWRSMLSFLFRRGSRLPVLFRGDSHLLGGRDVGASSAVRAALSRAAFRRCNAFLAVGQANRDYFLARGVPSGRIFFAPHCVDNERFQSAATPAARLALRSQLSIPEDAPLILFAGKFEPKKRPFDLLEAFRRLPAGDSYLLFAGSGELESALKSAAADHPRIRFLPFQNQSQMPALYAAADVFVLPSFGRHETWGLAVNEAMNCGCAVVVSDHVGCGPDLVREGENGCIFPAGDASALAQSLQRMLASDSCLRQAKDVGRAIIANYSFQAAREGLMEALRHTCCLNHGGPKPCPPDV